MFKILNTGKGNKQYISTMQSYGLLSTVSQTINGQNPKPQSLY